ncbi:PTS glucose transporter subunit IIA [Yokenella regensburgei]|uniref:PTS sugar transporter subunit IIA n=1 Tax=Yokenella regensburgei TaxID=158877 RepID=UPI003F14D2D1
MRQLTSTTTPYHLTTLYAPISGNTLELEKVNDVVFSENLVGVGVAIVPDRDNEIDVLAPADGIIVNILPGSHAFFMKTDDGVELLVHFGLGTVKQEGKGFTRIAGIGQQVTRGETVLRVDTRLLEESDINTTTPVVIMSPELYDMKVITGGMSAGVSPLIHLHRR